MSANILPVLIFDLDMTLLDRQASIDNWLKDFAYRQGWKLKERKRFSQRFYELDQWGQGSRYQLFKTLHAEFLAEQSFAEFQHAFYTQAFRKLSYYPDALTSLQKLKEQGYRLALLSQGSPAMQKRKLGPLAPFFELKLFSEEVGISKPDPRLFEHAAYCLGVQPSRCIYIGDHPELDIQGASHANMRTIWVRRYPWPEPVKADAQINNLSELLPLLTKRGEASCLQIV